jgi:hypothetical protein
VLSADEAHGLGVVKMAPSYFARDLLLYYPLVRELHDLIQGVTLTATNATVDDHPPIIYPTGPYKIAPPVSAAPPAGGTVNPLSIGAVNLLAGKVA